MFINFFNVPPINPLTPSLPLYFDAVIKMARLDANVTLSNVFLPVSFPSRIDAVFGMGRTVAIALGAT